MVIKNERELEQIVSRILRAAGADDQNVGIVAHHLVQSNLCGVDTHGIIHIPLYVREIQDGQILPKARPSIAKESDVSALVRGNWTFGHCAARYAAEVAIEKARAQTMAIVSLVECHHIGRLGYYGEMAAGQGMIALVFGGGYSREAPRAAPFGGRERNLDTNPIAMAFANPEEDAGAPVMLDFATTALSGVKVQNAQRRGEKLPHGSILDKDGNPSREPDDYYNGGSFVAFGGHKGYAMMMAAEYMGRIFSGADTFADPRHGNMLFRHQGITMIVFKADLFQPMSAYAAGTDAMAKQTRAIPPAPGFDRVMVPGDPEARTRDIRQRDGIPIADDVWSSVAKTAKELGVEIG